MRLKILPAFLLAACTATVTTAPPPVVTVTAQTQTPPPEQHPVVVQKVEPTPVVVEPPPAPPTPPPPPAEPVEVTYSDPVYEDVSVAVDGTDIPTVDIFYSELAPYGSWYDDPSYGWVFAPNNAGHIPYSNGYWKNTDYGFTWVSNDPFGWATDHYGRWVWANRWVWRPDTTWGPAWVQWRTGEGYVGWAPLGYTDDAYIPDNHWRFVVAANLMNPQVHRYYATGSYNVYLGATYPIHRYNRHAKVAWVAGPDDAWLTRYKIEKRR